MKVFFSTVVLLLSLQSIAFAGDVESTALKPYMTYNITKAVNTYRFQVPNTPEGEPAPINSAICSAAGGALAIINLAKNAKFDLADALQKSRSSLTVEEFSELTRSYYRACIALPKP